MKIWCRICKDIQKFGEVGKISGRPLIVYECPRCFDLQIQVEEPRCFEEGLL